MFRQIFSREVPSFVELRKLETCLNDLMPGRWRWPERRWTSDDREVTVEFDSASDAILAKVTCHR
jgi:hypothetical protein